MVAMGNTKDLPADEGGFGEIDVGTHAATVDSAEAGKTNAGDDKVTLTFRLAGEKFAGRLLWQTLNIGHAKENVRANALKEWRRIKTACGRPDAEDTDAVIGIPLMIKVKRGKPSKDYPDPKNVIDGFGYLPAGGASSGSTGKVGGWS